MTNPLRVVDLFSGAGGLSEGFRQAGSAIVVASDMDPDACATFRHNFPEAAVVHGDIRQPAIRQAIVSAANGTADIVVGGPPCQAFSQMRNHSRLIDDPRNSLYREFVHMIERLQPRGFVMENVPGLQQMGVKEQVLDDLTIRGAYKVTSQVLDAADFDVPQSRKRLVFMGIRESERVDPCVPDGSGATDSFYLERRSSGARSRYRVRAIQEAPGLIDDLRNFRDARFVTAEQAISDLEFLKAGERHDVLETTHLPPPRSEFQARMREGLGPFLGNVSVPRLNADTKLRLSELPSGGNFRDLPIAMTKRYLTKARWGPSNGSGRLGRRHFYAYRRLHPDLWSWTLNTKADSVYHYRQLRALSVREFARLQSFPDRFLFVTDPREGPLPGRIDGGAAHSRYRQVGNAVPPLLARAIATSLLEVFAGGRRGRKSA